MNIDHSFELCMKGSRKKMGAEGAYGTRGRHAGHLTITQSVALLDTLLR